MAASGKGLSTEGTLASVTSVSGKLSHTNTPNQAKIQGHWPPQSFQTLSPWLPTSTRSHILLLLSTDTHTPQSSDCLLPQSSWNIHSSFHSGNPTSTPPCHVCDHFFTLWGTSFCQTINVASSLIGCNLVPINGRYGVVSHGKPVYLGLPF